MPTGLREHTKGTAGHRGLSPCLSRRRACGRSNAHRQRRPHLLPDAPTGPKSGCGTQASALVGGGYAGSPTRTAATFEWTGSALTVRTITAS